MQKIKSLVAVIFLFSFIMTGCKKTPATLSHSYTYHDPTSGADWQIDTVNQTITVTPVTNDNSPQLQSAIYYQQSHPGYVITPGPGNFILDEPLNAVTTLNGQITQTWFSIIGATDAKDANNAYTTNFYCMFKNGFGIGVQDCKGCLIENINFIGQFTLPNTFNITQIDTLPYSAWDDGQCSKNPTSPYTAIAIDPFSDPANYDGVVHQMYPNESQYYVPGMAKSGSTDVNIVNCRAQQFVVGFVVTPSFQQNGDLINFNNDRVDICKDGIAFTQAQSKACEVNDLMSWGQTFSVFDGINYGAGSGNGSTFADINTTNIAGNTHQVFNVEAKSFPLNATNVFAENVYKIGEVIGQAGAYFNGFQVDFQVASPGVPSPDFYYYGYMTTWVGCMLRIYNNGPGAEFDRLVLNMSGNSFQGGMMSAPPICANHEEALFQVQPGNYPTTFSNVAMYYTSPYELSVNNYDSVFNLGQAGAGYTLGYTLPVTVNTSNWTGSVVVPAATGNSVSVGDALTCYKFYSEFLLTNYDSYEYPLGFVTSVTLGSTQDTIYWRNSGQDIYTGQNLNIWDNKIKTSIY